MKNAAIASALSAANLVAESAPVLRKRPAFGTVPANVSTGWTYQLPNGTLKHITGCDGETAARIGRIERARWVRPHMDVDGRRIIASA